MSNTINRESNCDINNHITANRTCFDDVIEFFKNIGKQIKKFWIWLSRNISKFMDKIKRADWIGFFRDCITCWRRHREKNRRRRATTVSVYDINENDTELVDVELEISEGVEVWCEIDGDDNNDNDSVSSAEEVNTIDIEMGYTPEEFEQMKHVENVTNKETDVEQIYEIISDHDSDNNSDSESSDSVDSTDHIIIDFSEPIIIESSSSSGSDSDSDSESDNSIVENDIVIEDLEIGSESELELNVQGDISANSDENEEQGCDIIPKDEENETNINKSNTNIDIEMDEFFDSYIRDNKSPNSRNFDSFGDNAFVDTSVLFYDDGLDDLFQDAIQQFPTFSDFAPLPPPPTVKSAKPTVPERSKSVDSNLNNKTKKIQQDMYEINTMINRVNSDPVLRTMAHGSVMHPPQTTFFNTGGNKNIGSNSIMAKKKKRMNEKPRSAQSFSDKPKSAQTSAGLKKKRSGKQSAFKNNWTKAIHNSSENIESKRRVRPGNKNFGRRQRDNSYIVKSKTAKPLPPVPVKSRLAPKPVMNKTGGLGRQRLPSLPKPYKPVAKKTSILPQTKPLPPKPEAKSESEPEPEPMNKEEIKKNPYKAALMGELKKTLEEKNTQPQTLNVYNEPVVITPVPVKKTEVVEKKEEFPKIVMEKDIDTSEESKAFVKEIIEQVLEEETTKLEEKLNKSNAEAEVESEVPSTPSTPNDSVVSISASDEVTDAEAEAEADVGVDVMPEAKPESESESELKSEEDTFELNLEKNFAVLENLKAGERLWINENNELGIDNRYWGSSFTRGYNGQSGKRSVEFVTKMFNSYRTDPKYELNIQRALPGVNVLSQTYHNKFWGGNKEAETLDELIKSFEDEIRSASSSMVSTKADSNSDSDEDRGCEA